MVILKIEKKNVYMHKRRWVNSAFINSIKIDHESIFDKYFTFFLLSFSKFSIRSISDKLPVQ